MPGKVAYREERSMGHGTRNCREAEKGEMKFPKLNGNL